MSKYEKLVDHIRSMESNRVRNYVIPGLDSYLLENGKMRIFENSRNHEEQITPHSHRFDFICMVLKGHVYNKVWSKSCRGRNSDEFMLSQLSYNGEIGSHEVKDIEVSYYTTNSKLYKEGDLYSMKSDEIHSITFSKDSVVLFFEGPELTSTSEILQPYVNGEVIKTYEVKDYMFKRDKNDSDR